MPPPLPARYPRGVRATWLTDVHLNFLRPLALRAFYDRLNAERPEVVLLSGDIAESDSVVRFVDEIAAETGAPTYFVLGNHDYYRSSIRAVRDELSRRHGTRAKWLPAIAPVQLTASTVLVGVDGWGDARAGDPEGSNVLLSDWHAIDELKRGLVDRAHRIETLRRLGANDARTLRDLLARVPASERLVVVTHVPPFVEACWHEGKISEPAWLPWFTCIATGEVLVEHARAHPAQQMLVLCGHTHGDGVYRPLPNLEVRTGGAKYGAPAVQATIDL